LSGFQDCGYLPAAPNILASPPNALGEGAAVNFTGTKGNQMKNGMCGFVLFMFLGASAFAQGSTVTYTYFGNKARYGNPSGTLVLSNGNQLQYSTPSPGTSAFPEINSFITNNPCLRGAFTFVYGAAPFSTNASGSASFNLSNFSCILGPTNSAALTNATNISVSFVYQIANVVNGSPSPNPDQFNIYGDNSSNPAQPYPAGYRRPGSGVTNVIDLKNLFSPPSLGVSGPMRVRCKGPIFFDLELVQVNSGGNSNYLSGNSIIPPSVDLKKAVTSSLTITVQFSALTSNFWVDATDYASSNDFRAVEGWVKTNVARIHLDEFLRYDLSFLESDQNGRELLPTFASFYSASWVKATVGSPAPNPPLIYEYRRGGLGIPAARMAVLTTSGGTAASRADVLNTNSLSAGVYASSAGRSGEGYARSVAFNAFRFSDTVTTQIVFRATLDGQYSPPPFGLPSGNYGANAGVAVFDRLQFSELLRQQTNDYLIDNSFQDVITGPLSPALRGSASATLVNLSGTPNITIGNADSAGNRTITASLITGSFTASPATEYIVLVSLYAESYTGCLGDECGASSLYLYDSLKFATSPFTTTNGQPIATMAAAPDPALRVVNTAPAAPNTVSLTWASVIGRVYQLQFSPEVAPVAFTNIGETITATNTFTTANVSAPEAARGFYRVMAVQ
jgi:hypothetical protein